MTADRSQKRSRLWKGNKWEGEIILKDSLWSVPCQTPLWHPSESWKTRSCSAQRGWAAQSAVVCALATECEVFGPYGTSIDKTCRAQTFASTLEHHNSKNRWLRSCRDQTYLLLEHNPGDLNSTDMEAECAWFQLHSGDINSASP